MKDILFGCTSEAYIKHLAKRSYLSNKRRNLFVIVALILTSTMITSVFSISFSYIETYRLQQIRLMGTTADVAITNPSDEQLEELKDSSLISELGVSHRLGSIDTSQLSDIFLGIVWIDEEEWKCHRLPSISDVQGHYPSEKNEIMLPTWVISEMGITNPKLNMEIPLLYKLNNSEEYIKENFVLSGYYTDYMASRTNNRGIVYISKEFRDATSIPLNLEGSAVITFENDDSIIKNCKRLKEKIEFSSEQSFEIVPKDKTDSIMLFLTAGIVIFFIMFCSYLLIYNILYISVSRDIRFYGKLKTIGAGKKQIKNIIKKQVLRISSVGIPIGLALGAIFSFVVVPYTMNTMYSRSANTVTKISFSPLIFIGAMFFTFLTAIIGSMKPAKIAGNISPIAALHYIDVKEKKRISKKSHKFRLSRMAYENIFRTKKSTLLVFTSLFLGLALFLFTTGILSSINPENFVEQWGDSDFALTYSIHIDGKPITEDMVKDIQNIQGIQNMRITYVASPMVTMMIPYNENVFGKFIKSLEGKAGIDFSTTDKINAYTQNFYSGVYGIDSSYVEELNENAEEPVDLEAFENGEIVLLVKELDENGNNLIESGEVITVINGSTKHDFKIGSVFLDEDFQSGRGKERGTAPDLFISKNALKLIAPDTKIFRIAFDTDGQHDNAVLQQLKVATQSSADIQIFSRLEKSEEMREYIITIRILGMGLSILLLLIGVMNFINSMAVSVNNRKHEFAVLESIGMTKKQLREMLLYEGFYYWIISFGLLATLGTAIYVPLYLLFKQLVSYAVFTYPMTALILIELIVFIICVIVPIITYNMDNKESVIERLRNF